MILIVMLMVAGMIADGDDLIIMIKNLRCLCYDNDYYDCCSDNDYHHLQLVEKQRAVVGTGKS